MKPLLTFLLLTGVCFGQSKKEQIIDLNKRVDSLNTVLSTTRDNAAKEATELNTTIEALNKEITVLKENVTELENTNVKATEENEKLKTDLGELTQQNLALEAKLKIVEAKCAIPENDWEVIKSNLNNTTVESMEIRNWLNDIVDLTFYRYNDIMTLRLAEYTQDVASYNLGYDFDDVLSIDEMTIKYGDKFDLTYSIMGNKIFVALFESGNCGWTKRKIEKLERLGTLNNGEWYQLSIIGGCDAFDENIVRVVKVVREKGGYKIDNFLSLGDGWN